MAKTKNHRRRTRHTRRHRNRRGGSSHYPAPNPSDYSSGASFVSASVGSGDDQYSNVFASSKNLAAASPTTPSILLTPAATEDSAFKMK